MTRAARHLLAGLALALAVGVLMPTQGALAARESLRIAWYPFPPYQDVRQGAGGSLITGVDVDLAGELFLRVNRFVTFEVMDWSQVQQGLRDGSVDVAFGAFRTAERESYLYYSRPYRTETVGLFLRRGGESELDGATPKAILDEVRAKKLRIGVVESYYHGPEIQAFLAETEVADLTLVVDDAEDGVQQLVQGGIDVFIGDILVGEAVLLERALGSAVARHPFHLYTGSIHIVFGKANTGPELVAEVDRELGEMLEEGRYQEILRAAVSHIGFAMVVRRSWFSMLDAIGTLAFAISGVLIARRERYSVLGALVLSALPAFGGGIMRDLLSGREPLGVVQAPSLVVLVFVVVLGAHLLRYLPLGRRMTEIAVRGRRDGGGSEGLLDRLFQPKGLIGIFDALGLATFTVTGVFVAVATQTEPLWLWGPILAAVTGAGGGILRDVVRADADNPGLKRSFYAEIALLWGALLSVYMLARGFEAGPDEMAAAIVLTILGAFATRVSIIALAVRSPRF